MRQLILFRFLLLALSGNSQTVSGIRFEGLVHTQEDYLRKIILIEEGDQLDTNLINESVFLLRNFNLFFEVESDYFVSGNTCEVVFHIKEANYLYPIFSVSGFGDQIKLRAGANHINFLGRVQSCGVLYQWYDRHSFSLFHTMNRHANQTTGHTLAIAKYSTLEPLYFTQDSQQNDTVSQFNFDNYSVSGGGHYWIRPFLNTGLGGAYMFETYLQRDNAFALPGGDRFSFHKHQLFGSVTMNRVEGIYEKRKGMYAQLYGEWIHTYTNEFMNAGFFKASGNVRWYQLLGKRGNVALQSRIGLSTNNNSPFAPFVLDGFVNVRGIGNRVERGTAELIANAEYRFTLFTNRWITLQAAAFSDFGTLRAPGDPLSNLFLDAEQNVFVGSGMRVHLNVGYKTSMRVDYSLNPMNGAKLSGFTFGFDQFF